MQFFCKNLTKDFLYILHKCSASVLYILPCDWLALNFIARRNGVKVNRNNCLSKILILQMYFSEKGDLIVKKSFSTRAISILLALVMVFSLLGSLTASAATFSYNTGKRGTVCTSLSSKASSYYSSSYSYNTLSAKSSSSLKSSLKTLMTNTHSTKTSYDNIRTYTKYSDANAGSSSKIVDFYSSATYSGTWDDGSTWNREHIWCQSLGTFTTSNCGSDLHHLRPTDPKINSTRNNLPYGEVSGSYKTATSNDGDIGGYYTSSCFEPLDNVKGDVARILLYVHVRWGESNLSDLISTTTLLNWCKSDPVDTWEMGRNDVIQGIQGNRNVFIDYPEYAWLIFGQSVPSHTTPSGMAKSSSSGSGSTDSGSNSDSDTGSDSGSGSSISDGQYVIAAKVGSTYYAMSNSFASKISGTSITVSNGTVSSSNASGYAVTIKSTGSYYTISNGSSYLTYSSSTNFASSTSAYNWSISEGTNGSYRITAADSSTRGIIYNTSYSRFGAYAVSNASSSSTTYYDVELLPVSGSSSGSGSTDTDTSSYYTMTFSVNGSTSAIAPMTAESFTLPTPASYSGYTFAGWATSALTTATTTKPTLYSAGNTYTISSNITLYAIYSYTSSSKTYYTSKISSSGSGSGSSSSSYYTMTFSVNGSTSAIAPMTAESFTLPTPASYSGYTFAGWATSALTTATTTKPTLYSAGGTYTISANITLYAIYSYTSSSKTYYTSKPTVSTACQHSSTTNVAATAATCTTAGYTAGVYCNSCGTYVSGHSSVAATGHDYETTTVAPTSSSQGYDYHECANCGDSYMDNYVEANSSEGYTVTFVVPAGVTAIAPKQCTELTLPTPSGTPKYSTSDVQFVGWTTQVVDNSTTEPTIYDCTSTYTISSDVTLYAVYTYGGNGEMTFTMYDGSSSLYIGDSVIIVASSFNYAMSKKLNANSRKAAAITKNSDNTITISPDSDVAIFTLGWGVNGSSSSNQISFKDESGYLTTSSNTNNYMPTSSTLTAEGSFTFSLNDAKNVKLTAQGQYSRKIMRYNSSSKLFSCYSSSTKNAIKLYVLTSEGGSNLTYTTEFAAKRVHTDVTTITVPATCTENGSATTICNDCGTVLGVEVLPAAGHSYVNGYCACGDMAPVDADGAVHASDLTIYNKSLSLQSYVAFNFLVEKSVLENYDSCYVVFERSDAKSGVISETCYGQAFGNDFMQFEYKVYSYQMSDTLTATLYALKDGVVYVGETYSSSVRDYAMSKLAESTDDAYKTMVANLLTYGAKAQVYSDYRTEDMADSALGQYAAFVTTSLPTVANKASSTNKGLTGVTLFENALGIASSVQIQFITKLSAGYSTDKLYAEVCWDRDGTAMSKKIDGADFATVGNGSYYTVVFQDLTAKEGRTPVTVTIYDKTTGEAVSESWTYSIESYVANRQNSSAKVLAVLNSMMNYYDSAAAYFKN